MKKIFVSYFSAFLLFISVACVIALLPSPNLLNFVTDFFEKPKNATRKLKLYWFIPDGFRADPAVFNLFKWAEEGKLPNIKKLMEAGTYGYSIPVFPGHTPSNFATLFTGAHPSIHGVADGPMRLPRYPLSIVSKSGFSSHAKRVPPIWYTLEKSGFKVGLLSIPGSTPPELSAGITVKGRWGGWGVDFSAKNFHSANDLALRSRQGLENRLFEHGQKLTEYVTAMPVGSWRKMPTSFSEPWEVKLENWGKIVYGLAYDSSNDNKKNYDRMQFSFDRRVIWADLYLGEWSEWLPITLSWETGNDYKLHTPKKADWELNLSEIKVPTEAKIKIIALDNQDKFRIRFYFNALNRFLAKPPEIADRLNEYAGPMVDYPDNYPPQLIYHPKDKETFLEEARMSLTWHRKAARYFIEHTDAEIVIHDIYTPNQFLTSRWWMGYLDPQSPFYFDIDEQARKQLWSETMEIYEGIDQILGEIMASADDDTYIILSSDHGVIPLHTRVRLNNLFAEEGLLKYTIDPVTGYSKIDWKNSRAVFLKMDNIYINPAGLGGNYLRPEGLEYLKLRESVTALLKNLKTINHVRPVAAVVPYDQADLLNLPGDRVGDLIVANSAGFGFSEEITNDGEVFAKSLTSGYKQAVIPHEEKGMWTPFIVSGPGIQKGQLLKKHIHHTDQYPTIMKMLKQPIPPFVQGEVLSELFTSP